eukprot:Anaeramoba_ignava/c20380_g1_i3.p1 GENE.c20380_g1_i3~~c20380_g1_i3.p1  ORF type:complete len:723 (+),score=219.96 c20380_g1_i3:290-2170(+)
MFRLIRQNLSIFANAILNAKKLKKDAIETLSHSAILSVFSHLVNEYEEKLFLNLIKKCFKIRFKECTKDLSRNVISGNKLFARLLSAYSKNVDCDSYLISSLHEPIMGILQSVEIKSFAKNPEIQHNLICKSFVQGLRDKIPLMPLGISWITKLIKDLCEKNHNNDHDDIIGDFLFFRFLNPVIISPEKFGIIHDFPIMPIQRSTLTNIAKTLSQRKQSSIESGISSYLEEVTNVPESYSKSIESIGSHKNGEMQNSSQFAIHKKLVRLRDLFELHKILHEYAIQVKQQNSKLVDNPLIKFLIKIGKPIIVVTEKEKEKYVSLDISPKKRITTDTFESQNQILNKVSGVTKNIDNSKEISNVENEKTKIDPSLLNEIQELLKLCFCSIEDIREEDGDNLTQVLSIQIRKAQLIGSLSLSSLLDCTLNKLKQVPEEIQNSNFEIIIRHSLEDKTSKFKLKEIMKKRHEQESISKLYQTLIDKANAKKRSYHDFIRSLVAHSFISNSSSTLKNMEKKIEECTSLEELKIIAKNFFDTIHHLISTDSLCSFFKNELKDLTRIVQNYLLSSIYINFFYPKFVEKTLETTDSQFSMKIIEIRRYITADFLQIPQKFWEQDLWCLPILGIFY